MIRLCTTSLTLQFWASPYHKMHAFTSVGQFRAERSASALKVLDPGFPRDDPPATPPSQPKPSFPTDVPAPEPHDVPAPQPIDVPPPEPGRIPEPAKPPRRSDQNPKPRPVP